MFNRTGLVALLGSILAVVFADGSSQPATKPLVPPGRIPSVRPAKPAARSSRKSMYPVVWFSTIHSGT